MDYKLKYNKYKIKYLNLKYNIIGGKKENIKKYIGVFTDCDTVQNKDNCYDFSGNVFDNNDNDLGKINKRGYWEKEIMVDGKNKITFTDTSNKKLNYFWKPIQEWHKPKQEELDKIKTFYNPTYNKNEFITSGYMEQIYNNIPINILSWNICWDCMSNNTTYGELGKKCNQFKIIKNISCLDNVSIFINRKKYTFIGLQEASGWQRIYKNGLNNYMGYVHSIGGKNELVTFYDKKRFEPIYLKIGYIVPPTARPYHIIFFEEIDTLNKYIFINLHNGHHITKDLLEEKINHDINNCLILDKSNEHDTSNKEYIYNNTDITNYIDNNKFKVIILGDFNDHGEEYWKGLKFLKNIKVTSIKEPPKTCCSEDRKINTKEVKIGDYILINSKLEYIDSCNVPKDFNKDSDNYPTSDHLPVEAIIISKK
jgi:hypothetical protein